MISLIKFITSDFLKKSFGRTEMLAKGLNWFTGIVLSFLLGQDDFGKVGVLLAIYNLGNLSFSSFIQHLVFKKKYRIRIKEFIILFVPAIVVISLILDKLLPIGLLDLLLVLISALTFSLNKVDFSYYRINDLVRPFTKKKLFFQIALLFLSTALALKLNSSLAYSISLTISLLLIANIKDINLFKLKLIEIKYIFAYSFPFFLNGIFKNISRYFDRIYISKELGNYDAGSYTLLFFFSTTVLMANYALNSNLEQKFYTENHLDSERDYFNKSFILNLIFPLLSIIGYYFYVFFNDNYSGLYFSLILLLSGNCLVPYYTVGLIKANKLKKQKFLPLLTLITSCFNIFLNVLLIPIYGVFGASLIYFLTNILQTLIIIKFLKIELGRNFYTFFFIGLVVILLKQFY